MAVALNGLHQRAAGKHQEVSLLTCLTTLRRLGVDAIEHRSGGLSALAGILTSLSPWGAATSWTWKMIRLALVGRRGAFHRISAAHRARLQW